MKNRVMASLKINIMPTVYRWFDQKCYFLESKVGPFPSNPLLLFKIIHQLNRLNYIFAKVLATIFQISALKNLKFSQSFFYFALFGFWLWENYISHSKTNVILKRHVNKFFPIENAYHDANQTDKTKEQKLSVTEQ